MAARELSASTLAYGVEAMNCLRGPRALTQALEFVDLPSDLQDGMGMGPTFRALGVLCSRPCIGLVNLTSGKERLAKDVRFYIRADASLALQVDCNRNKNLEDYMRQAGYSRAEALVAIESLFCLKKIGINYG